MINSNILKTWNEERIKKEVKRNYFIIQEAWSKKDLETLKDYLTPQLLDAWQTKMNWYEFQERRNELTNIKLISKNLQDNRFTDCYPV